MRVAVAGVETAAFSLEATTGRVIEAVLTHYAQPANNPISGVYGGERGGGSAIDATARRGAAAFHR